MGNPGITHHIKRNGDQSTYIVQCLHADGTRTALKILVRGDPSVRMNARKQMHQ